MLGSQFYVSPRQWGAKGDGTSDDTAAVSAAFGSGRPVFLDGLFVITSPIQVFLSQSGPRSFSVFGAGRQYSQIIFSAANCYIQINHGSTGNPMGNPYTPVTNVTTLRDFAVVPNNTSFQPAIWLVGNPSTGSGDTTFFIENVHVLPAYTGAYSQHGFYLKDMRNGTISDCIVMGKYFDNGVGGGTSGVVWTASASPASNPVDLHIRDCQFQHVYRGLWLAASGAGAGAPSDWQGIYVNNCTFLSDNYGIAAFSSDNFSAFLNTRGCHFNCNEYGIYAQNIWHPVLCDNNFMFGGSNSSVVGIQSGGVNQSWAIGGHICENHFYFGRNPAISTATAIVSGSGGSPNGGCFTNVSNNTTQQSNAGSVTLLGSFGGTIYQSGNNSFV